LRSVFLVDEIKVDFVRKNNCKFVFKKRHLYWEDLIKKLSEVALSTKIFEEGEMIFELKSLVKNKEKVDKAITTIVKYLYTEGSVRDEERFIEKWEEFYGKKGKVNLKMGTNINAVNYNETATYLKLFAIQKESMKHMENATATLLETIPCEVNTIADIGSGPGLVNQYIPYYYDVLAVDINQEILRQNRRKTCIGDILDLPLQDKSVDMTISCDVLEHIEPDKLNRAVSELKRVSKKYIYIQVPHDEILRYGIAKCPNCGNIWHVNFHKNKFTLDILKRYEDNEWKISQINYTGEVKNEIDNPEIYAKII
jgi:hypothetical protein